MESGACRESRAAKAYSIPGDSNVVIVSFWMCDYCFGWGLLNTTQDPKAYYTSVKGLGNRLPARSTRCQLRRHPTAVQAVGSGCAHIKATE